MENKLKALFGFQKFQGNKGLAKMIDEAEQSTNRELADEKLSYAVASVYFIKTTMFFILASS